MAEFYCVSIAAWCFSHMQHREYLEESIPGEDAPEKWEVQCDVC